MSVTRRKFFKAASGGVAVAASALSVLGRPSRARAQERARDAARGSTPYIRGFQPDLNGLMSVRFEWARRQYRLAERYRQREEEIHAALKTAEDVAAWGDRVQKHHLQAFGGLLPRPSRLAYETVRELTVDGVRAEVIRFESLPNFVVPGTLYHRTQPGVGPGVLIVCGHLWPCKEYPDYQRLARELALNGFTVLVFDWMGLGERQARLRPDGTIVGGGSREHNYMGLPCHLAGFNLGRYMVHDASCALTVLASQPSVDASRIGVTGHSGGGLMTSYMALFDERVAAAVPVCYICDHHRRLVAALGADAESTVQGALAEGINSIDAFAPFLPRPTLIAGVESDIFPTEGLLREVERLRRMYEAAGSPQNFEYFLTPGTHSYNEAIRKIAVRFLSKHLGGSEDVKLRSDSAIPVSQAETFHVSKSGLLYRDEPERARPNEINYRYFKEIEREKVAPEKLPGRLARLLALDVEETSRTEPYARYIRKESLEDGEVRYFAIVSEYNLNLGGIGLFPRAQSGDPNSSAAAPGVAWLVVTERGANEVEQRGHWALEKLKRGELVLFADVRGRGGVEAARINAMARHERGGTEAWFNYSSALLGTSEVAQRTHDVLRWYAYLKRLGYPASAVNVLTQGSTGMSVLFGSTLAGPPRSFQWVEPLPDWDEVIRARDYDSSQFKRSLGVFGIAREFSMKELLVYVSST
jgi:dienelactone hydrolase